VSFTDDRTESSSAVAISTVKASSLERLCTSSVKKRSSAAPATTASRAT
jgi:hypothetical protein